MRRLSSPLSKLKESYEIVVVGSGYGGAIAASRMARAGRDVCLLERGKEKVPGEYPDTTPEALAEIQVNRKNLAGGEQARTAMYDFRVNKDINVFLGCGLGGTSLVNANVSLKADKWVFEDPAWPKEVLNDYDTTLAAGYKHAEDMLKPEPYPNSSPKLKKLTALEKSAQSLGESFYRPPINVTFKSGINHVGVEQPACNECGDCVTGCNVGSKNTLLMNYLPDAKNHGAHIFAQAEVTWIEKASTGKWIVHFHALHTGREVFDAPSLSVQADKVILGAGALGSTEILLRSRNKGLPLSPKTGKSFTGNGDVLGFAYNTDDEINGVGFGNKKPSGREPVGPCITGIIDMRGPERKEKGMVIEEGSMPGALADILPAGLSKAASTSGTDTDSGLMDRAQELARQVASLVPVIGPYQGAIRNTQTFLVMSHDDADGSMKLDDNKLKIEWPGVGAQPIFTEVDARLLSATKPLGGTFARNPMWKTFLKAKGDLITVHPLGGCPMGADGALGAVNHKGNVFTGLSTETHPGLYITDGAVIPRSLGVNPLLTISALAERTCALLAEDNGWTIDYSLPSKPQPGDSATPQTIGIQFTERMKGFFAKTQSTDFKQAADEGKRAGQELKFTLTIQSEDLDAMLADPSHRAALFGTVSAPLLSPTPLEASQGQFTLLDKDPNEPDTRRMTYQMRLLAADGTHFFLSGFKRVHNDFAGLDLWADTTTLYTTVYAGTDATAPVFGRGILKIAAVDFAKQLTTLSVSNAPNVAARLAATAKFGKFFAGSLWDIFGPLAGGNESALMAPIGGSSLESVKHGTSPVRKKRPLRAPIPEIHDVLAKDGTRLRLTRYKAGSKGPVMLVHGLGVSSLIFSIDTIDTNMVEFLCDGDYDVWNLDFRASIALRASNDKFSGDDIANNDFPAAVEHILKKTEAPSIQAVVHCFGSTTWFMSMLAGLQGVRSFVSSQIATHTRGTLMTNLKTGLHVPQFLDKLGIDSLDAYAGEHPGWQDRLLDAALHAYPIPFEEWCGNDVCRRIAFMYAPLYKHKNINDATHDAMHEMFGIANIKSFEHIARLARRGVLVSADGADIYMPHLERLNLPITFIHGADNDCFAPESTKLTYDLLQANFDPLNYERHVIEDYGHIDCIYGKNAAEDVFPHVKAHLDKYQL